MKRRQIETARLPIYLIFSYLVCETCSSNQQLSMELNHKSFQGNRYYLRLSNCSHHFGHPFLIAHYSDHRIALLIYLSV